MEALQPSSSRPYAAAAGKKPAAKRRRRLQHTADRTYASRFSAGPMIICGVGGSSKWLARDAMMQFGYYIHDDSSVHRGDNAAFLDSEKLAKTLLAPFNGSTSWQLRDLGPEARGLLLRSMDRAWRETMDKVPNDRTERWGTKGPRNRFLMPAHRSLLNNYFGGFRSPPIRLLRLVQVVRDVRDLTFFGFHSEFHFDKAFRPPTPAAEASRLARLWSKQNLELLKWSEANLNQGEQHFVLRMEDLVFDPDRTMSVLAAWLELAPMVGHVSVRETKRHYHDYRSLASTMSTREAMLLPPDSPLRVKWTAFATNTTTQSAYRYGTYWRPAGSPRSSARLTCEKWPESTTLLVAKAAQQAMAVFGYVATCADGSFCADPEHFMTDDGFSRPARAFYRRLLAVERLVKA